ncbi:hypothetical protein [Streptomyces sp. MAI_2237]
MRAGEQVVRRAPAPAAVRLAQQLAVLAQVVRLEEHRAGRDTDPLADGLRAVDTSLTRAAGRL